MKAVIIFALIAMSFSMDIRSKILQEDPEVVKKWEQFLIKYRKTDTYKTQEDAWYRFNVFKKNLDIAAW